MADWLNILYTAISANQVSPILITMITFSLRNTRYITESRFILTQVLTDFEV